MAQLADIVAAEKTRTDFRAHREIRLYGDGSFYRAYEWSAWLCCRYVRQNKVTRRFVKLLGADVVYIGFPRTSLQKYVLEGSEVEECADGSVVLRLPTTLFPPESECETLPTDFEAWRGHLPPPDAKTERKKENENETQQTVQPVSPIGIMQQLLAFPIESRTPIDCMLFLAEIKGKLVQTASKKD